MGRYGVWILPGLKKGGTIAIYRQGAAGVAKAHRTGDVQVNLEDASTNGPCTFRGLRVFKVDTLYFPCRIGRYEFVVAGQTLFDGPFAGGLQGYQGAALLQPGFDFVNRVLSAG